MPNGVITPPFAQIASVLVDRAVGKPLDYGVPESLNEKLRPGSRVSVPLRFSKAKGTVIALRPPTHFPGLLPIESHLADESIDTTDLYDLALWMSKYYITPLEKILRVILPSSVRKKGKEKTQLFVKKVWSQNELAALCTTLRDTSPSQTQVLEALLSHPKGLLLTELLSLSKTSKSPIDTLVKKGALEYKQVQIDRSLIHDEEFFQTKPKTLTSAQQHCLEKIQKDMDAHRFQTHLIHGITGSGKTEIYMQAMDIALKNEQGVILLVPEISLTTQTIERLKSRFTNRMALWQHRLSIGERFDSWHAIKSGKVSIVVGARSAIFTPIKNLGLIIVDEEHDASYKQYEEAPAYHARDLAVMRGKLSKSVVILGSATPSLESQTNALQGKYNLSSLSTRAAGAQRPKVTIVDMKHEGEKNKGFTLFSDMLLEGIKNRAQQGEQILLFLNRRGYHSSKYCTSCNAVIECPHCDTSLTFHRGENILACHICGYTLSPPPRKCPQCGSEEMMKFKGIGTEQVERTLHALLPDVRTLRMDADTTKHKGSHDQLFRQFRSGKADVLIGTQMIAKGLHFPSVTLVGIIHADSALHIPDFRSTETVFQLLTQVSGRSGRSTLPGEVIIQTLMPDHPIIKLASQENYKEFYDSEIKSRELFAFPPIKRLIKLSFSGENEKKTQQVAEAYVKALRSKLPQDIALYPVTPCGHAKIKAKYRFQSLIKCDSPLQLTTTLKAMPLYSKQVRLLIDVDPLSTFF